MKFEILPLGSLCDGVSSGGTPKSTKPEYYGGDIPWLNTKEVNFNRIHFTERCISQLGLENSSAKWIAAPAVIVAMYGATAGKSAISFIPLTTNQARCNLNINKNKADYRYIYYYLKWKFNELSSLANGGAQQNLNAQLIKGFPVRIPNLFSQRAIADLLWVIDNKIELNNAINNNLEQQAQALYKAWFIDFEPFGGICPENWEKANIYSIANIIYGAPFSSKLFNTDRIGKPIVRIRDLKEQVLVTYTTEVHSKGHLIQPGDIVVGMDGEFRPYLWGNAEAWLNQRVCIFESKEAIDKAFVLFTIKPLLSVIERTQVATTVIHIGKKDFDSFEILLPDRKALDDFGSITTPMISQIISNRLENKRLAELRDSLLPKLMSGELDVSGIDL